MSNPCKLLIMQGQSASGGVHVRFRVGQGRQLRLLDDAAVGLLFCRSESDLISFGVEATIGARKLNIIRQAVLANPSLLRPRRMGGDFSYKSIII